MGAKINDATTAVTQRHGTRITTMIQFANYATYKLLYGITTISKTKTKKSKLN